MEAPQDGDTSRVRIKNALTERDHLRVPLRLHGLEPPEIALVKRNLSG